jgi:hypothetical protein
MAICQYRNIHFWSYLFSLGTNPFREREYYYSTDLIYTIAHCPILFPTVGWPTTSALAANLAYLYMLPLYTFFSSLYHNVVIQSTLLQHCDNTIFFGFVCLIECLITKLLTEWRRRRHSISHLSSVYIEALELHLINKVLILSYQFNSTAPWFFAFWFYYLTN